MRLSDQTLNTWATLGGYEIDRHENQLDCASKLKLAAVHGDIERYERAASSGRNLPLAKRKLAVLTHAAEEAELLEVERLR